MRGFGKFQQAQMKRVDTRIPDLFRHIRSSVDILEQIILQPYQPPRETLFPANETKTAPAPPTPAELTKFVYTIREITTLIGISRTTLYRVMRSGELPFVKLGSRTLVRATDLRTWTESWRHG